LHCRLVCDSRLTLAQLLELLVESHDVLIFEGFAMSDISCEALLGAVVEVLHQASAIVVESTAYIAHTIFTGIAEP
jgi:hypothetical protein